MSPGTGAIGGNNFERNTGRLLSATPFADTVDLNIPLNLLSDTQISAGYVVYAVHFSCAQTGMSSAIVTWSQGCFET